MNTSPSVTTAQPTPGFEPRYGGMEIIEAEGKFIIRQRNNGAFFASTYSRVDARLIAAAPELLKVAAELVQQIRGGKDFRDMMTAKLRVKMNLWQVSLNRMVSDAEAAIATAEGRA